MGVVVEVFHRFDVEFTWEERRDDGVDELLWERGEAGALGYFGRSSFSTA